ncbi:MAG: twin-arginine translocation signal domain-containing protein [Gemmatimonas sp.]|nr:twin-arginine translocation signal domain-containing protein [Gemmatimonas sp.]
MTRNGEMAEDQRRTISRRDLLKGVGAAGAAAILPGKVDEGSAQPASPGAGTDPGRARSFAEVPRPRRLENLTADEADTLEAIMARLIPADDLGPGAVEAGALNYLDRALGGFLAGEREEYGLNLAALDRYCLSSRGAPFVELSTTDQDSVLIDLEGGSATGSGAGFTGSSASFFAMVKGHTWQGMFGDPYYGGNAGFIGWDLLRYPGVRLGVSAADQQRLEAGELLPERRSAYDSEMFEKATAMQRAQGGVEHGD